VRARRDADERVVVRGVTARLSHLVSHLTVHVFKDDYALATTPSTFGGMRSLLVPSPSVPIFPDGPTAVVVSPVPVPASVYGLGSSSVEDTHPPRTSVLNQQLPSSPYLSPVAARSTPTANPAIDSRVAHRAFIIAPSGQYSRRFPVV
jgi:zinc transporter 6